MIENKKRMQKQKEWCETKANCTDTRVQARGCYFSEDGTCTFDPKKINRCAQFDSQDKCAGGRAQGPNGKPIPCEWSADENVCVTKAMQYGMKKKVEMRERLQKLKTWCETKANCTDPRVHLRGCYPGEVKGTCSLQPEKINRPSDENAMKRDGRSKKLEIEEKMQKMKTWCETEANCTDPSVHVRGCYPAEVAGTCYLDYQKINWCARFSSEDKCTRGAVKGLKGEPIQCKWSSEENACNHVEQTPRDKGRPDKGGMEKRPGMRDKEKGMEKQDEEFTGACVSQLSWCFQAGTDENLCKPLVEIGQCAFVE